MSCRSFVYFLVVTVYLLAGPDWGAHTMSINYLVIGKHLVMMHLNPDCKQLSWSGSVLIIWGESSFLFFSCFLSLNGTNQYFFTLTKGQKPACTVMCKVSLVILNPQRSLWALLKFEYDPNECWMGVHCFLTFTVSMLLCHTSCKWPKKKKEKKRN